MSGITTGSSHLLADLPLLTLISPALRFQVKESLGVILQMYPLVKMLDTCVRWFKMFENIKA